MARESEPTEDALEILERLKPGAVIECIHHTSRPSMVGLRLHVRSGESWTLKVMAWDHALKGVEGESLWSLSPRSTWVDHDTFASPFGVGQQATWRFLEVTRIEIALMLDRRLRPGRENDGMQDQVLRAPEPRYLRR